jgi:AraC-like DNA-binding protein
MNPARLQLQDWSQIRADLAWIYEGQVEPVHRDAACRPDLLGAWLVLAGEARLVQEKQTFRAARGDWLVIRQGRGHQYFSEDARILSIRFTAEWPDRTPLYDAGLSVLLKSGRFPRLVEAGHALLEVARPHIPAHTNMLPGQPMPFGDFVAIRRAFWGWLIELHEALTSVGVEATRTLLDDERIVNVLRVVDRLPFSTRLREGELAKLAGLQAGHFVRAFRQQVGRTPKRYFDELRRSACRRTLAGSDTPIKEVAFDLGFARLSDFSAWFRRVEGISPREFRRLHYKKPGTL